jgi:hypothetical protein
MRTYKELTEAKSNFDKDTASVIKQLQKLKITYKEQSFTSDSKKIIAYIGNMEVGSVILRDYGTGLGVSVLQPEGIFESDELYDIIRSKFDR